MILGLERDWGKWPGWFASLSTAQQATLLGEYRARLHEAKVRRLKAAAQGATAKGPRRG